MGLLAVVDIGIDTHQEPVVYMRNDCEVCLAEGFTASTRVGLEFQNRTLIATLNVVGETVLPPGHIGLSRVAIQRSQTRNGDLIRVIHAPQVKSLGSVRKKIFGHKLGDQEISGIIEDISAHLYSDIEIASFLSVCAGSRLDIDEIISLTRAMVACGKRLDWPQHAQVFDKHCIGGLPGNRTTPLVVAIVSAAGLIIPKTSSRAITSPAGTADTMEALTNVHLDLSDIQRVVEKTGACLAWGGAVNLSPADDLLIRIERALDLDGEGQLIASVLSKKIAAGSTHAVIDLPVGDSAKVRSQMEAERLASLFVQVGSACGLNSRCVVTDGSQPVGRGIGPVEEARDLLAVLQCQSEAPLDLRERALVLAAHLLDLARNTGFEACLEKARVLLDSGQAWMQFQRIAEAQGGLKKLPRANFEHVLTAPTDGIINAIDNRRLSRLAKLAGAPFGPAAGLRLHVRLGDEVAQHEPLMTLLCNSSGERDYALEYYDSQAGIVDIGEGR
ncbi:MAG: thymidine phosphorylase family protein [Gammaproteobacteria bacterium]|nr:thymidine phosphorylase family protein [Gammaproteobacteria bacterium]